MSRAGLAALSGACFAAGVALVLACGAGRSGKDVATAVGADVCEELAGDPSDPFVQVACKSASGAIVNLVLPRTAWLAMPRRAKDAGAGGGG